MASLLVSNDTNNTSQSYYGSLGRIMQTFIMPSGYDLIEYIDIYCKEVGTPPGNLTLELYATSGGFPTGSALASVSITASTTGASLAWERFNIADTTVTPGARYAIVLKQTSVSSTSNAFFIGRSTSSTYGSGIGYYSVDGGSSYTSTGGDWNFRVYGSLSVAIPTVTTTDPATNITSSSADVDGNVTSDGGGTITERGIVYSNTNPIPTTSNSKVVVSGTTGTFTGNLTSLLPGTTYYARAYAINSAGTGYGDVVEFSTLTTTPTVLTVGYSAVSSIGAFLSGNATSDGGSPITERGFVYNTSGTPTISDTKEAVSGTTGTYSTTITSMSANTLYYVRAFATNSEGTSYGAEVSFTTLDIVKYWAQSFTATLTGSVTKVSLSCRLALGTSATLKIHIYSDTAGSPGTLIASATKNITNTSYSNVEIPITASITNTSVYWIVIEDIYIAGSYHIYIGANSAGGYAGGAIKYTKSSAPTTWINTSYTTHDMVFSVTQQPALTVNHNLQIKYKRKYV